LLCLVVPGLSFFVLERRLLGWIFGAAYVVLLGTFLVALGYPVGNAAYGLLISVHAASIVYLEGRWLSDSRFSGRLLLGLATVFAVWALLYAPAMRFAERHWFIPLRVGTKVVVINPGVDHRSLRRGDRVAYEVGDKYDRWAAQGIVLNAGLGVDPVLGLPGDEIRFTREAVLVNEQPFPRREWMPEEGELQVPENVWFIWPQIGIDIRGAAGVTQVPAVLQKAALVKRDKIIGRAYRHWFGRRQSP
jgi:hypothetical protein